MHAKLILYPSLLTKYVIKQTLQIMEGEQPNPEGELARFQTLAAEGDLLLQKGTLHAAISIFTKALEIKPMDQHCLVQRSRCYIQIGAAKEALEDANASLQNKEDYYKGVYLKAEALYYQGNFENALLFFHRGNRLRPELNEFRVGILKCREAINNSIGDPKRLKIHVPPKLRRTLIQLSELKDSEKVLEEKKRAITNVNLSGAMQSKLLQEMYEDKVYLQVMESSPGVCK
jgi:tetratricopeptide (TPR) repeat protein